MSSYVQMFLVLIITVVSPIMSLMSEFLVHRISSFFNILRLVIYLSYNILLLYSLHVTR